jgi:hypothetical protein
VTHSRVDEASLKKATDIVRANLPPRYFVLDQLERYVIGTQYEHLAPWGLDHLPLELVEHEVPRRQVRPNDISRLFQRGFVNAGVGH